MGADVVRLRLLSMSMNYHFIGYSTDGLMLFQDLEYPSDAPQAFPTDAALRACASTDCLVDGDKYFAITERHAEVRGLVRRAMEE
jgi:hypothetical protein